jgi:hyperosmotically inducible periplasmic protein
MRTKSIVTVAVGLMGFGVLTCACVAQQGVGERVGERVGETVQGVGRTLKRGMQDFTDVVRRRFEIVRADVNRMEAHPRVYSRLHWDKGLYGSKIEVHMLRDGTVLLSGTVPDEEAKKRAVEIAHGTVGVTAVIDDLTPLVSGEARKTTIRTTR